jgi:hypothetical protein
MIKLTLAGLATGIACITIVSCNDNQAAIAKQSAAPETKTAIKAPVKKDSAAIGIIQAANYELKLHRAFVYTPQGSDVLAGFTPRPGHKFVYLDVSLKNTGVDVVDGGQIFIALKITGDNGVEYKKPAAALAAFTSENPGASNLDEYNALWEKFQHGEFHRDIIYAVEVPGSMTHFTLSIPADRMRKQWKTIKFSL